MSLFDVNTYICGNCGTVDKFKRVVSGSFIVEVLAFIIGVFLAIAISAVFLIIPVVYTIWRMTSGRTCCAACGSENKLPIDSPAGKQLHDKFHPTADVTAE